MLITFQFPLADTRAFLGSETNELNIPNWLAPLPDRDFVRHFGLLRRRPRGGLTGWIGESIICEADRAIRFKYMRPYKDSKSDLVVPLKVAFRRFYFDGYAVGKFEVGFGAQIGTNRLSSRQTRELINHIFQLPVDLPNPTGDVTRSLFWLAGKELARLYEMSSSRTSTMYPDEYEMHGSQVKEGKLLIFVVHALKEMIQVPYFGKFIPIKWESSLAHYFVPFRGMQIRMWMVREGEYKEENDITRQIRIFLLRLHAEQECFRLILRSIAPGQINPPARSTASNTLQRYLNLATTRISRLEKKADMWSEAEVGELAREAEDYILPGERDALLEALKNIDVRRNIFHDVDEFMKKDINYYFIQEYIREQTVAKKTSISTGNISNVSGQLFFGNFDQVEANLNANSQTELAEALRSLADAISTSDHLSNDKKQEQLEIITTIGEEANKSDPNKSILKMLGDGVIASLKVIPDIATAAVAAAPLIEKLYN
jgi:hypothetical protein